MSNNQNPYVGPSPFERDDAPRFYGRKDEAAELFSLTRAHSIVLFYSQSGAGKTSLINAGVIPKFQNERIEVFPVARVGIKLPKGVNAERIENVFLFNTLLSLEREEKKWDFDQLGKMSLADYLKKKAFNGQPKYSYPLRVLIFDQFEEIFTRFPEHWSSREAFFISISEALEKDPLLRIVFAMREEYIAELEPFAPMLPLRFQKRFRLERLRKDEAKKAIEGPVANTGRSYAKNVADALVNNLLKQQIKYFDGTRATPGEFVEPVQLQIVCRSLWDELPPDVSVIDQRAISQFGDVDVALARYYGKCLEKIGEDNPEVNEAGLRIWIQQSLITPVNTRATAYVDEGGTEGVSATTLRMLEEQRLIRFELRGGAKWYELTHDRFIEPIIKSNKEWFESLPEGSFIYELEQRAAEWDKAGRKDEALLPEDMVGKYKTTANYSSELIKITPTGLLEEYVKASETAAVRKKTKALVGKVVAIAIGSVIVVALIAYFFVTKYRDAQAKRTIAATQAEKGKQAKEYSTLPGREFNGLISGMEAATLSDPDDAPPELVEGLRAVLSIVDRKVWLRYPVSFATQPDRFQLSADGTLALTVNNNDLCVWNAVTGQKTFDECIPRDKAGEWGKVQFSPDGKLVYALVIPLPLVTTPKSTTPKTSSSRVNQDSQETPVAPLERSLVKVFNSRTGQSLEQVEAALAGVASFEISNNSVLADFGVGGVRIVDVSSGSTHNPAPARQNSWYQIALSPDGDRLVAVYGGRQVDLLATRENDRIVSSFDVGADKNIKIWDVISFSPDGKNGVLVRRSEGSEANGFVWENAFGKRLVSFKTKIAFPQHLAFSADNKLIVLSDEKRSEVIDVSTGNSVSTIDLPEGTLRRAGFKTLLLQFGKGTCRVLMWDGNNQSPLQPTYTCVSNISGIEAGPDGNKLIVSDEDKTIQIWTIATPLPTATLDMDQLITEGCKKLLPRKNEFTQFDKLCKPRVDSW
jgi:WD40 repeat protein